MDFLTKLPDFATDKLFGAFEWLFKIPIIGDLIATFFGYSSGKTLIEDLKLETRDRRSIQSLMEYGNNRIPMKDGSGNMVRSGNGEIVYSEGTEKGKSNGEIKLLENINFTELNYKDIKPFYKTLRDNGINPNQKDFWKTVFGNEGKIETGE